MELELEIGKSVEENAALYFERAKKAKRKLEGARKAVQETSRKLGGMKDFIQVKEKDVQKSKKQWFEQFHWFHSSSGFLVIGGRDAKDNELIVKKHLDEGDFFLHADVHGGSVCVVKANKNPVPLQTLEQAASFAAVFSRAWKQGVAGIDVYAVQSDQVSKSAPSGESLGAGAFMIYGKRQWFRNVPLVLAVGVKTEGNALKFISGPVDAVSPVSSVFFRILQGSDDSVKVAKQIISAVSKKLGVKVKAVDEVVRLLPAGGAKVVY